MRREAELLKTTRIASILPQPASPRRKSQPWLYVRTKRGGYFRIGEAGEVERFGRRTLRLGSGSITEHRWYPCSLQGVRWLQVISSGRLVQKLNQEQAHDQASAFAGDCVSDEQPTRATAVVPAEQLRLFPRAIASNFASPCGI